MRNKFTKFTFFIFILLFCSTSTVLAQNQEPNTNYNREEFPDFNTIATQNLEYAPKSKLLLTVLSFQEPFGGSVEYLSIKKSGEVSCNGVSGFGTSAQHYSDLSEERANKFIALLNNLQVQEQSAYLIPKEKDKHTTLIYRQNGEYKRVDYLGELPFNVKETIDLLQKELDENDTFILEMKRIREAQKNKTKTISSDPQ